MRAKSIGPLALIALAIGCGDNEARVPAQSLSVVTWNLYLGSDLERLVFVPSAADIPQAVAGVWADVTKSRFPERARLLAAEILRAPPDVIALQEVSLYRQQHPGDWTSGQAPNATDVALDFLALLEAELHEQTSGSIPRYRTVAVTTNGDAELPAAAAVPKIPGTSPPAGFDLRLTDRDVILVRDDIEATEAEGGTFTATLAVPVGGAGGVTLRFVRGFAAADLRLANRRVHFVNSHLEIGIAPVQEAQARELRAALAGVDDPIVLAGDFNSPADGSGTASYGLLTTRAGGERPFVDTWTSNDSSGAAGPTCCVNLYAPNDNPRDRIDLVLMRGPMRARSVEVIGATAHTEDGLRPSDHLGVRAVLDLL